MSEETTGQCEAIEDRVTELCRLKTTLGDIRNSESVGRSVIKDLRDLLAEHLNAREFIALCDRLGIEPSGGVGEIHSKAVESSNAS